MDTIRLDHVGIVTATDQENADVAAFFRDVLGMPVAGDPAGGYAEVDVGGQVIALHRGAMSDLGPHGGTLIQCVCPDVRGRVEQIRARGGDVAVEPWDTDWGQVSAYVRGPHGVMVELAQPAGSVGQ
jgi:catechol 2,3-dioxygenase-like lactoylglutathione lyase family enzyme